MLVSILVGWLAFSVLIVAALVLSSLANLVLKGIGKGKDKWRSAREA